MSVGLFALVLSIYGYVNSPRHCERPEDVTIEDYYRQGPFPGVGGLLVGEKVVEDLEIQSASPHHVLLHCETPFGS